MIWVYLETGCLPREALPPALIITPEKPCLLYCMLRRDIVELSRCDGAGLDDGYQEVAS